ncbi:MutS-related protein [Pseudoflavitalea rhizosphaerae]|uniref:MutS-related protein n=1 Tax=Pseudoflavitalea rhizosphaerae TaxID=1884793 RepID=UPI000F8EA7CA|nr:DNA mismatch repair protein [Pseudoflavitalea rhizosphaerae]
MLFTTDKQTLDDLNVFGKHGSDSLFNIFNRCATRGGAAVLEEMFRYPLSDHATINRRSAIISYFAGAEKNFPFPSSHFDAIEPYMANRDERTKLTQENNTIGRKMSNMVAPDNTTQMIMKGVAAVADLMQGARIFLLELAIPDHHPYAQERDSIFSILNSPVFETVFNLKGKPGFAQTAELDILFRFRYREEIRQFLQRLYQLDLYMSIARVAGERNFAFAKALPGNTLSVQLDRVFHPGVPKAVPNSIRIHPDGNLIFLTGANMAGKSTFMKSLSIAMFLAHMGFPVPAASMEFSVMDGIYTTINLPDNLGMGASHFYAEVLRVKKMAAELSQGKKLFIVFDELFRGTNVKDAYEATIAITKGFATRHNSLFVISTHIIEAGDVLRADTPNVRFIYLPTRMNGNTPVYTYTLEEGITDDRHGMIIINNEGILDILEAGIQQTQPA